MEIAMLRFIKGTSPAWLILALGCNGGVETGHKAINKAGEHRLKETDVFFRDGGAPHEADRKPAKIDTRLLEAKENDVKTGQAKISYLGNQKTPIGNVVFTTD